MNRPSRGRAHHRRGTLRHRKVKERIVEYLAVQARAHKLRPVLAWRCAGVGKTSLGRSSRARGPRIRRQSLAVRDEAEIRGTGAPISARCGPAVTNLKRPNVEPAFPAARSTARQFPRDPASAPLEVPRPREEQPLPGPVYRDRLRPWTSCSSPPPTRGTCRSVGWTGWSHPPRRLYPKTRSSRSPRATRSHRTNRTASGGRLT